MAAKGQISYGNEIRRKLIHLASLLIPIIALFVEQQTRLVVLWSMAVVMVSMDMAFHYSGFVYGMTKRLFGGLMRSHELDRSKLQLNGASWVLLSAAICVTVFSLEVFVIAFSVLIVSDLSAALIGRRFGKTPLMGKSLEGTIAFFVSGVAVVVAYGLYFQSGPWYLFAGALGALLGSIAELVAPKLRVDDNLLVPMVVGSTMILARSIAPFQIGSM